MSRKSKGINAERELIHKFWNTGIWVAARCAGSGSMVYPSPDIIASNGNAVLVIECKSNKGDCIYLTKKEVQELNTFSKLFKALPIIGARFDRKEWSFINLDDLKETEKSFVISHNLVKEKGVDFNRLIKIHSR